MPTVCLGVWPRDTAVLLSGTCSAGHGPQEGRVEQSHTSGVQVRKCPGPLWEDLSIVGRGANPLRLCGLCGPLAIAQGRELDRRERKQGGWGCPDAP